MSELANWIYWEESAYYCSECIEIRLKEINANKEFAEELKGNECGYYQDQAPEDHPIYYCRCWKELISNYN